MAILVLINFRNRIIATHPFYNNSCEGYCFSILSWNIHCPDGASKERQVQIANKILELGAEVVQLNEYNIDSCLVLDSIINSRYVYSHLVDAHEKCGNAIYSTIKLHNQGTISAKVEGRYASMMAVSSSLNEREFNIIGLHLPSNSGDENSNVSFFKIKHFYNLYKGQQKQRSVMISEVKKSIIESKIPTIVLGDFNDFSASSPLDSLKNIGLKDSWWEGGFGYGATFHQGLIRLRIDHILHSPQLKLCGIRIFDSNLSDHNPIIASFSLGNE